MNLKFRYCLYAITKLSSSLFFILFYLPKIEDTVVPVPSGYVKFKSPPFNSRALPVSINSNDDQLTMGHWQYCIGLGYR